jgi:hypothetical protein
MTVLEQLDSFYDFASQSMRSNPTVLSIDEIYFVWRARHPADRELAESIAALKSAYADLEAGETGRSARDALQEVCQELGLVLDE